MPLEIAESIWCLPNCVGLKHTLPDGVVMSIRIRRVVADKYQVSLCSPLNAGCHINAPIPCAYTSSRLSVLCRCIYA